MPITINGSGTVTGISAGGLPTSSITTASLADNAVTYAKIGTTEQGQLCQAWVNFNGTGTVAIRASYNVSSITDNGVGDYTVNFTTALVDANYSIIIAAKRGSFTEPLFGSQSGATAPAAGSCRIITGQGGFTFLDGDYVNVAIFR